MFQQNRQFYANGMMNEHQLGQYANALYSYCKVMRVPKMGVAPALITILTGLTATLLFAALGESLQTALLIGTPLSAMFAFICWLAYRYRKGASKRLNSYLVPDGGQAMFLDFANAQPFIDDQFRLGRYFLFIRNGAVIRRDGITDVVRVNTHAGIYLSIKVNDENGAMSLPLCRVHTLKAHTEIDEIRRMLLQRPW
ncbi:MAG: hypothetical protein K6F91_07885 [Ruminococcus sp.]|nr:hypothetical protein [Ruminococcus sp.]